MRTGCTVVPQVELDELEEQRSWGFHLLAFPASIKSLTLRAALSSAFRIFAIALSTRALQFACREVTL